MSAAAPFQVLVVCTGNVSRSPYAERLLRSAFADLAVQTGQPEWAGHVDVASAGVAAMIGAPMDPPMAALLAERGVDPAGHAARAIDRELVEAADLVLTATREHRRDVVRLLPRASRRVFALPEFLRLLEDAETVGALDVRDSVTSAEILRAATAAAADRRGFVEPPEDPADDDVDDPYRRSAATYARVAAQLAELSDGIVAALGRAVERSAVGSGR